MSLETLPMRERASIVNETLGRRFENLLPQVMQETGFDAWIIVCHEDNHDPVFGTMIPWQSWTPILQILLFCRPGIDREVERLNISRTNMRGLMPNSPWHPNGEEDQWQCLRRLLADRDPKRIGINTSEIIWAADGLTATLKERLLAALGPDLSHRCESAEPLCIRWLETRLPRELDLYHQVNRIAHGLIQQCYSRGVIVPGETSTEDLLWAYWQRAAELSLHPSFTPSFRIYRSPAQRERFRNTRVIQEGDMLHCDVGFHYLRLTSDHQELAYVLRSGETQAPEGLQRGMDESIRLQDIFIESWECGLTGNEILARALSRAKDEGLALPKVYSHSLGHFLHEPGPLMGLPWQQTDIPGRGEVLMHPNTCYTVEVSTEHTVPEWEEASVPFMMEQDAAITDDGVHYLGGRQTEFHLI